MTVASAPRSSRPEWRDDLAAYTRPRVGRSLIDLATSVVPYLALSVLMYVALDVSYLLTLALAVPAAGFLLRTYIVFHDCTHGSLLPSKRANAWVGRALGLVVPLVTIGAIETDPEHLDVAFRPLPKGVSEVLRGVKRAVGR